MRPGIRSRRQVKMGIKEELTQKIQDKTLTMGVCGLGYVGLPLAVDKAKHGFKTIGFDVQQEKVDQVNTGKNYILKMWFFSQIT